MTVSPDTLVQNTADAGNALARSDGFEGLARAGFVARGLIYLIIGILAIKLAFGAGGKTTDQQGAMQTVANQPLGTALLILLAIGLAGYALWRLTHAALGHGPERSDSTADRVTALCSGIAYAGFCVLAVEILLGSRSSRTPDSTTAGVFGWPAGTWLVGIAGALFIGVAAFQGYRGLSHDFLKDSKTEQMSSAIKRWITWIGTFGHLARMVVFGLVGVFLIKAAIDYQPSKAVGIDGALAEVRAGSQGPILLGIVAAGLIAFAIYSFTDARYRRI